MRSRSFLSLGLALTLAGCMRGGVGWYATQSVSPSGMLDMDDRLRRAMASGSHELALTGVTKRKGEYAPPDRLLRKLYQGVTAYYAGRYDESGAALQTASEMAEDRWTKSVSKGALSVMTNDLVLPYSPGQSERMLTHYYAMLGYLKKDDVLGAAVEARRLSALLQRFSESADASEKPMRATLHYLAGAVFEAAGEHTDADVSYRNARALLAPVVAVATDTAPTDSAAHVARTRVVVRSSRSAARKPVPPPRAAAPTALVRRDSAVRAPTGEVVLVFEAGFVAHRVEQSLHIGLDSDESTRMSDDDDDVHEDRAEPIAARVMRQLSSESDRGVYCEWPNCRSMRIGGERDHDSDIWLKIAWPAFVRPRASARPSGLYISGLDSAAAIPMLMLANVSDAVVADFERQRVQMLARTIARATAKYLITKKAEKKSDFGGMLASVGVNLLEHADTRSWHLLPGHIAVARVSLPPGRHRLSVDLGSVGGGSVGRRVDLGEVDVTVGKITFVSTRVWRESGTSAAVIAGHRKPSECCN